MESTMSHQNMSILGREGRRVLEQKYLLYAKILRKLRWNAAIIQWYWELWRKHIGNVEMYHALEECTCWCCVFFLISVCEHERESRLKIEQTQQSETDTATIYREILTPVYLMPHKILCAHTHYRISLLSQSPSWVFSKSFYNTF